MTGPLDDLRVIDLSSGQPGGMATMVLADFGADVIKVEPPGGDPARSEAAAPMWLRGKRSVVLDLATPEGRAQLHALAGGADVVVASFAPGEAEPLGASYATLSASNDGLVYCSITGWGPRGPYADYPADEALVSAKSGRMQAFAGVVRRQGPAFSAVRVGTHAATQSALSGILAALLVRDRIGRGQLVETSLLQGMFPYDFRTLLSAQLTERYPQFLANDAYARFGQDTMPMLGYTPIRTKDGRWIQFANLLEHHVMGSLDAMGLLDQVVANPRYAGSPRALGPEPLEELRNLIYERALERTGSEWMSTFVEHGNVAADLVGPAVEALQHTDMLVNGEVVDVEHPRLGTVRQLGLLARLTETPGEVGAPGPEPGKHTLQVLAEPPRPPWTPPAARAPGGRGVNGAVPPPRHPLEGIMVLEFATIIAAPLGVSGLGDLGARVIKVEPTTGGDPMRGLGVGLGAMFGAAKTTASKESICIDLKSEQGREIVRRLLPQADVIVHNYRPSVPERLGIGYEQVCELRPDIVYLSVNGYGPDGPGARRPSAHPIPGAVAGGALMQAGTGWPPAGAESLEVLREASRWFARANESNPDPNTSMVVTSAAMLGLFARQVTGKGQRIFLTMLGANGYANAEDFLAYDGKPARPTLDAGLFGQEALYRLYPARDGWVMLAAREEGQWAAFCAAAGASALAIDPRFATAAERRANDAALAEALGAVFAARDADEWERVLTGARVGCVNAGGYPDAGSFFLEDPHVGENGWLPEVQHSLWGPYRRWGPRFNFSETPPRLGPGVIAGEHTDPLLRELGYEEPEVEALRAAGIVWSEQPMDLSRPPTSVAAGT